MTENHSEGVRRILLLAHTGREEARDVSRAVVASLVDHGLVVRLLENEAKELDLPPHERVESVALEDADPGACELALVIGGDGTILRAAELTHGTVTPLLGVNLGHVGFLAEAESEDVENIIEMIVHRRYSSEERLTLDVTVHLDKELVASTWALNEASVEKAARQRMLEVVVEVDGRPLSRFGCDGVVCATPTGSTAYNFSAGGPVVWPAVEALLMVPISAHALFARPMVVAPTSVLAVEVLPTQRGPGRAVVRRPTHRRPAAGCADRGPPRTVRRCGWSGCTRRRSPIVWSPSSACRSTAGAVPPSAGAGPSSPDEARVIEEIRISSLGVIEESVLEVGPGLTVITGETGAGKTMLVTALGLLLGGRADTGAVRTGARAARVEGLVRADAGAGRRGRRARRGGRGRSAAARPPGLRRGSLAGVPGWRLGPGVGPGPGR